ncbi:MAG: wax ester/triacylglycerol synthase family O-acyltransferase [Solirubrobacteraceae bacterium]
MTLPRLTREDMAILRLEAGDIAGHTLKLLVLDPPAGGPRPGLEEIRTAVGARLASAPELLRRLASTPLGLAAPAWVDDDDFAIERHVRPVEAREPVGPERLRQIVAGAMRERLDRAHPLWSLDVVERLEDGGLALIWKLHHVMADGTAAMRIGREVLWDTEPGMRTPPAAPWTPAPAPGWTGLLGDAVQEGVRSAVAGAARLPRLLAPQAWRSALGEARRLPGAIGRDMLPARGESPLARRISGQREVAFATAPLGRLRAIEKAHGEGVTVNDVVLAVVAGALRSWIERHHGPLPALRVKVPVSLHDREAADDHLANRDSFMCVTLPLGEPDPVRRLLNINRQTSERKRQHDPEVIDELFRDLARGSRSLERLAESLAGSPRVFGLTVSNVPGPREPLYVAGCPVRSMQSLAEIGQRHGLRACAVSYAGTVYFGLCADPTVVDRLAYLAQALEDEVAALALGA